MVSDADPFQTLYRFMPIPSITWRRQGRDFVLVDFNRAAGEFTDGLIVEYLGERAGRLYADRPDIRRDMARAFRDRCVVRRETRYRMFTKGIEKVIDFTFAYIPPDRVLSHMVDNTERREAEGRLIQSEMERRILALRLLNAVEQERKRIAAELHDSIGQYLTTLKFNAENTLTLLRGGNPDSAVRMLEGGIPLVQQTIEELRRIIMDLRPTILDDLGIVATISWFCREFQSANPATRIHSELSVREEDIPPRLRIILFRILQEALNNAVRHGNARNVRIRLARRNRRIELAVADDGTGFDPKEVMGRHDRHRGLGLLSMRERAELGNGLFEVESAPGKGTHVRASWPLDAR